MPIPLALIASLAQSLPGIIGLFRKRPRFPAYPEYQGYTPEFRGRLLEAIRNRISEQKGRSLETLQGGARARGFGQSGQMGRIAADVEIAGNKDLTEATLDIEKSEIDRYQEYLARRAQHSLGKYSAEMGEYGAGSEAAGASLGGGLSNLYDLFSQWNQGGYRTPSYQRPFLNYRRYR